MSVATQTLQKLIDSAKAVHDLRIMLEPFRTGNPAASVSVSRFTVAELNAQVTAAVEALASMAVATTVLGTALSGTATAAALATSQLTLTATLADLTTDDVTASAVWASDDVAVATVGAATGLVTGVAAGTCNITATYKGFTATVEFTTTA